jgi:hypothetical protein
VQNLYTLEKIMAAENPNSAAPAAPPAPPVPGAPDPAALQRELVNERFESVAAKAGLDESAVELVAPAAHRWLEENKRAGTKADLAEFFAGLKSRTPRLFAQAPAVAPAPTPVAAQPKNTAPVAPSAPAPAPGAIETPYSRWQALRAAGRHDEAKAYYMRHSRGITRSAP